VRIGDKLDGALEPTMSAPATEKLRSLSKGEIRRVADPLGLIMKANAEEEAKWSQKVYENGLIEAFQRVSNGFSVDRVVADPELDAAFEGACKDMSLPGDIRWWNRQLFQLRKSGKLGHIPTERRTEISWQDCDAFLFASEIAWRHMLDRGPKSLDEILCDPSWAAEFDRLAAALAPGEDFTPLQFRWGALKLRKESKRTKVRAGLMKKNPRSFIEPFSSPIPVAARALRRLPEQPGVYLVMGGKGNQPLYAGEALNLHKRMKRQFERDPLKSFWKKQATEIFVQFFTAEPDVSLLLAYQSLCVRKRRPELNVIDPALR
jgi:site-specific DNA-methyltransferase (adenine-specific)